MPARHGGWPGFRSLFGVCGGPTSEEIYAHRVRELTDIRSGRMRPADALLCFAWLGTR